MKAHLVSQVLLRRFTKNNQIKVNSLITNKNGLANPKRIGYIEVPEEIFSSVEHKYGYTETRAASAFPYLDDGTLLKHEKHKESIKKLMSLHFVRSQALMQLFSTSQEEQFKKLIEDAQRDHPDKADDIIKSIPALKQKWQIDLIKKIPGMIKKNITKVEKYVNQFDIEIGVAPDDVNFILGDNPTINISEDGKIGVLAGVAITNSSSFLMPLSPKHLVALITKNNSSHYKPLSSKTVGNFNAKVLSQCLREYYTLPEK